MSLFKKEPNFFYDNSSSGLQNFDFSIYCPHPYTNWSLNPSYQPKDQQKQHTLEGFRKTTEHSSVRGQDPTNFSVFCIGGSTTYCTEIYDFQKTWPAKLVNKLSSSLAKDVSVYNAGVGGWGTLQSMIRLSAWGPILKPDLTIIYQSKNDLTPYYNGRDNQESILPLHENIVLQLSAEMCDSPKEFKRNNNGIASIYSRYMNPSEDGLSRFGQEELALTKTRYRLMANLCESWNGKVLFVPEIIRGGSYLPLMNKIHQAMEDVAKDMSNSSFFDIRDLMPLQDNYFLDKMHFSPEGCDLFSDIMSNAIKKHSES